MATSGTTTPRTGMTLAIVGCGNMGTAILDGVMAACRKASSTGAQPRFTEIVACVQSYASRDRLEERFGSELIGMSVDPEVTTLSVYKQENAMAMELADVILLACKPYMINEVLGQDGVHEALEGKLVISVVAGSPPYKLHSAMGVEKEHCHIVRAMPNIAARLGESMTVIEDTDLPSEWAETTDWIFRQLGKTAPISSELYNVGGVLAGTSAALFSVALDGVLDAAVSQGLRRPEARKIMAQSLIGLGKMLEEGETPDELREKISSPKGTTIEGLMSLEEDRVRYAYTQAVLKALKRSRTM